MNKLYPDITIDNKDVCDIFHFAKYKILPFSPSPSHASANFKLLHLDIWGPISTASIYGHRYFLPIVDDHSRYVWIVLLKSKGEVFSHVRNFIVMIENQCHTTPKTI